MAKLNLSSKFSVLLAVMFLVGIALTSAALNQALNSIAQREISTRGLLLLQNMNSVRSYTSNHIRPLLQEDLETSPTFISETVPAFSAREVFEIARDNPLYEAYIYKEATLNPTNPVDQADEFETELVGQFRSDPELKEITGFRDIDGEEKFYVARPLAIGSESCLECHGHVEDAPASLLSTYPDGGGFGWELDEIVAAQVIYVPAGNVVDEARLFLTTTLAIVALAFIIVIIFMNSFLKRLVVRPVEHMAALAEVISADKLTLEAVETPGLLKATKRSDELGRLADTFRQMAREVYEREAKLKQQIAELRIEIDHQKKDAAVSEITDSKYFKDLKTKATELRNKGEVEEKGDGQG